MDPRCDSRTLSSDFDKFLRSQITSRSHEATLSLEIKRDRSPIEGIAVLNRDFFLNPLQLIDVHLRPLAWSECLETRGCIVVFIQWNAQYGSPLIATKLEMENGTRRDGRFPCNVLIAFRMLSIFLPGTNTRRSIISVTMIFAVRKHVHIFISYPKKNLYAIAQHCYTQRMILLKYLKRLNTHRYLKIILLDYQNNYLTI